MNVFDTAVCSSDIRYYFLTIVFFQTMQQANKTMDPEKTMKMLQEFDKESTKMEMSEEMSESMKRLIR